MWQGHVTEYKSSGSERGDLDQQNSSNGETTNNTEVQSRSSNNYSSRPPKLNKAKRKDESITNELLESVGDHFKRPRGKNRRPL
ncbi:hypothetical protein QTP88_000851 [Uroleucon formosanum]